MNNLLANVVGRFAGKSPPCFRVSSIYFLWLGNLEDVEIFKRDNNFFQRIFYFKIFSITCVIGRFSLVILENSLRSTNSAI